MTEGAPQLHLDPQQPLAGQMSALVQQQVEQALVRFETEPPSTAIHEARKMLKRLRALIRLGRGWLGDSQYRAENLRYRDVARRLATRREGAARLELVEALATAPENEPHRSLLSGLHRRLTGAQVGGDGDEVAVIARVLDELPRIATGAAGWPLLSDADARMLDGLRRTYRQGRRRLAASRAGPTAENLHEWRKAVKYLWTQIELLTAAWPAMLEPLGSELHQLSDLLGEDHDLYELQLLLDADPDLLPDPASRATLRSLIDARRQDRQRQAWPLGARLFAETPSAFIQRLGDYWTLASRDD